MPGMGELLIILLIVLLIFGANKLPAIGDSIGRSIKNFKRAAGGENELEVSKKKELSADSDSSERVRDEEALLGHPVPARPARVSVDAVHAHRQPLRPLPRSRRPGAAMSRTQICISPLRETPTPPRRRTRTV